MAISGLYARWSDLFSYSVVAFSAIFFVVDPFAVVPVFITITEGDDEKKRRQMAARACLVSGAILLTFLIAGGLIFKMFSLTLAAFKIAGGILLLLTSLDMLRSQQPARTRTSGMEINEAMSKPDVAIVPLAMPLLAGPGAIATVMVLAAQAVHIWQFLLVALSVVVTAAVSYLLLRAASLVNRFLGNSGRAILERVMGLLLVAIAVQFMLGGIHDAFPEIFSRAATPPIPPA